MRIEMSASRQAVIEVGSESGNVFIDFRPDPEIEIGEIHYITPAKARILGEALIRSARVAEASMPGDW